MKRAVVIALLVLGPFARPAAADSPVAIVEEVQDYVAPKTVIKLGANGSIVISYMNSCRRERISGIGTVIVGTEESIVHLADVQGEKTECDSSQAHATTRETSEVAATVLRSVGKSASTTIRPQLTLYGTSPLIEAKGRGTLLIERLDVTGERQQIELNGNQLKGKFYDFAGANRALAAGGIYVAKFGASHVVFRIDSQAKPGATPIIGRLIRLE